MSTTLQTQEPPVYFPWYRGKYVAHQGILTLADPSSFEVWYPFRECYFANGGAYPGDGERSLYLRFAALSEDDPHNRRKNKPTERELLRFAQRYGLPDYLGPPGKPVAPWQGGGYPTSWMVEDSRRMGSWLALWEAVSNEDAKRTRLALADLRSAQIKCFIHAGTRAIMPVAWSLRARPQGGGRSTPYHVAAFFRPPRPTQETIRSLEKAALLVFSRMVVWGIQGKGGQPSELLGGYSLPDIKAAFEALISDSAQRGLEVFDRFEKAFRQNDSCEPTDAGVLWFGKDLLRHYANWAVSEYYVPTTKMHFPGRNPESLGLAMDVMLALDVLGGLMIRRCANPRCHHSPFFTPDDPRQHFCCEVCNNADRANRRRKEEKKRKQQGP